MLKQKINSFIAAIFILGLSSSFLFGQTRPSVSLKITPENYEAGQQVTVSLSSFTIDLDSSENEWFVGGTLFKKGVGLKQIEILAPKADEKLDIRVSVLQNNVSVETSTSLNTTSLEMFFESLDGYVPVWYLGRSHIAEESVVKVVAVPNTFKAIYEPDDKTYTWAKNNFKDMSQSGRGKQVFVTKLSPFANNESISVAVGNTSKRVLLEPRPTLVSLYENSPLTGTRFQKELQSDLTLSRDEVTFEVVPWFFSAQNRNSNSLSVIWSVNGLPTKTNDKSLLNLRKTPEQKGRATVSVSIKHKERTLQNQRSIINIEI